MLQEWTVLGIDQSVNGTGFCVLKNARPALLETLSMETYQGMDRLVAICDRVVALVGEHQPDIIVMEEPTGHVKSASIMQLVELFGCVKLQIHRLGYPFGREAILSPGKAFMQQNQSSMKKFMLGDGSMSKDSRYLLEIFERIKVSFKDDNQADAYMHAWMVSIVRAVMRGNISIDTLPSYQQEALIARGVKHAKGLSMTKAMKLPPTEKSKLVGF
jgi:Holliday junction resolvasome RuvABC endonuclease subunit